MQEKRETMLKILFDTAEVYNLKELEKLGNKAGVVLQSVKEVLESLMFDSLIEIEKIGSSNFYWAFPSKATCALQNRIKKARLGTEEDQKSIEGLSKEVAELEATRVRTDSRSAKLAQLRELHAKKAALEGELATLKDNDPAVLEEMAAKVKVALEGANRWTDNVWALKSYLVKKRGMQAREVDKALQLSDDFDYVDES